MKKQQITAPSQLEKKYGGTRGEVTSFYPIEMPPGPFEPVISDGVEVEPNFDAPKDCYKLLSEFNEVGPLILNPEKSRDSTPIERMERNKPVDGNFDVSHLVID